MKLHRLTLTNYRGVTHRDIEFPDRGVVVISGANATTAPIRDTCQ